MCLLHFLVAHSKEYGINVSAVHINHGIRGKEATRDENFVKSYCQDNGISLDVYHCNIPEKAKNEGISEELAGRKARYEIFESYTVGCVVATAHNLNDCEETFIFNLARGTGLSGLKGIPPVRNAFIRPLINCTKQEINDYCNSNNVPFVTDSTNLSEDYSRNFIRLNIIPLLCRLNPAFHKNFSRAQSLLALDNDFLNTLTDEELARNKTENGYLISCIGDLHPALAQRYISAVLSRLSSGDAEKKHIDFIFEHFNEDFEITLPGGDIIVCNSFVLYKKITGNNIVDDFEVSATGEYVFGRYTVKLAVSKNKFTTCSQNIDKKYFKYFADYDTIRGNLSLTKIREGDKIKIAGSKITKAIRKIFAENNIPANDRAAVPIIRDEQGVIATPFCGPADRNRLTNTTNSILEITFEENVQ